MVAFSCCVYDGGEEEKHNLDAAREKGWRGKFRRPGRVIEPDAIRRNGKCPMTPLEVCVLIVLDFSLLHFLLNATASPNRDGFTMFCIFHILEN